MTRRINNLLLLLMLVVSNTASALDDNERAILQRVGISADDGALYINDEGHIYSVDLSSRGLKTIPFPLFELPYVVDINFSSNPFNGDIGVLASAYLQSNPTISPVLNVLSIENCGLTGNIGPLAGALSQIDYLYACDNSITDISPIPDGMKCIVRLDMQQYDLTVDFTPGVTTSESLRSQLPRAALYDSWNYDFRTWFAIECYPGGEYNFRIDVGEEFSYWIDDQVRLVNGDTFYAESGNGKFHLTLHFQEGDVNLSGAIDEADVQETADYILANNTAYAYNVTAGDMNHDGNINVLDLVALQHRVAGTTPVTTTVGQNTLAISDLKMPHNEALLPYVLTNSNDIAAMQFDLTLPDGLCGWYNNAEPTERTEGDEYRVNSDYIGLDNGMETRRILIWSPTGKNISAGDGAVASSRLQKDDDWKLDFGSLKIDNAILSSPDSRNVLTQVTAGTIDFTHLPQLAVTASKTEMTEGENVQLTVTLPEATAQPLEVTLQSEDATRFSFTSKQTIAAGETSTTFTVTAIEDDIPLLDIANIFTVSAPDCDPAEVIVLLKDNDMPMLQLTIEPAEINELDGDGAATATLRRVSNIDKKVIVELTDNSDGRLTYQQDRIVMDAGVEEMTFHLGANDNDVIDGDTTYTLTAAIYVASCQCSVSNTQSAGFVQAQLRVLDDDGPNGHRPTREAPDAIVTGIKCNTNEAEVGSKVTLTATIKNQGTAALGIVPVTFYNAKTGDKAGTMMSYGSQAAGASQDIVCNVWLTSVGQQRFYAVVNEEETVSELRYANNTSAEIIVKSKAPYTAALDTDAKVYNKGNKVTFSGQLTGPTDKIQYTPVDIYIINDGVREVQTVRTNEHGLFTYEWTPYALQSGRFTAGACYPGDETEEAMVTFDVYGLRRADNSPISYQVTIDEPYKGNIMLENPGVLPLTAVRAAVVSAPQGCKAEVSIPNYIAADAKVPLQLTITGSQPSPEKRWERIEIVVATNEGVELPLILNYYAQYAQGHLKTNEPEIRTTMFKDRPRDYPLLLTNQGKGHTGKLTLSLPKCITSPMGTTLSGLAPGDSVMLPLRFVPIEGMQLNVPLEGMFSIDCEHGVGLTMNFAVTPVSQEKGILHVDVTDEFTYYTDDKPHVAGAQVVLRNPSTLTLVAQGVTDEHGIFSAELPEGCYQLNVAADKHNSYQNLIVVDPGMTTEKEVFLQYESVKVSWTVEEGEIEDEYKIVTTVDYETRVPAPVVLMHVVPEQLGLSTMEPGDTILYHTVVTNVGLIAALNWGVGFPSEEAFTFKPLEPHQGKDIQPGQSVDIPVIVIRNPIPQPGSGDDSGNDDDGKHGNDGSVIPCGMSQTLGYEYECNGTQGGGASCTLMALKGCGSEGSFSGGPMDGGPSSGGGGGNVLLPTGDGGSVSDCNPLVIDWKKLADCAIQFIPYVGSMKGVVDCAENVQKSIDNDGKKIGVAVGDCVMSAVGTAFPAFGMAWNYLNCIASFCGFDNAVDGIFHVLFASKHRTAFTRSADIEPSYVTYFKEVAGIMLDEQLAYYNMCLEYFGNGDWLTKKGNVELARIMEEVVPAVGNYMLQVPDIPDYTYLFGDLERPVNPDGLKDQWMTKHFYERINNTTKWLQTGEESDNMIHADKMMEYLNKMRDAEFEAGRRNYYSTAEMFATEANAFLERLSESSSGVCATVKLQIDQKMTLTRQAFHGTLTIENGAEHAAMQDVKLALNIHSVDGKIATAKEFAIDVEKLNGFEGELTLDAGWSLAAGTTGTATILFVPTKYAAPVRPVDYSFGGTLSYVDGNTGLRVTRELYPVTLTVNPTPELDLTYFMQRDIYGDDAMTEDVVEPMVPAEFTVLINNKGYGDANNVKMVTEQPKIIENKKQLLIDFEILSSQLNGQDKVMAMGESVATEFGTIPAHSQSYATWELQSTLLGHFVKYNIEATHVTSHNNPDLSILDQVTIHELIHGFTPLNVQSSMLNVQRAFLCNDELDPDDQPDQVYFSNATQQHVRMAADMQTAKVKEDNELQYTLTVLPTEQGWTYGIVEDPTEGRNRLASVMRMSDKVMLPLDNVWQTDRTLRDGHEPRYEDLLHFIGEVPVDGETYLLTFEPAPDVVLAVEGYEGVAEEISVVTTPVQSLVVRFNKPIDAATFTTADVTLTCQGKHLKTDAIAISKVDDSKFTLDISKLTLSDGYYVLTVQTANITDAEGFNGRVGKQAAWIQLMGTGIVSMPRGEGREGRTYDLKGLPIAGKGRGILVVKGKKVIIK